VAPAAAASADLNHAPRSNDHGHHGRSTIAAPAATDQLGMAMGTEHVDNFVDALFAKPDEKTLAA